MKFSLSSSLILKSDFGNVYYDVYEPESSNGYTIQIAHGMIEHKGRYKWLCQRLVSEGYRVYINDHRGHGESIGGGVFLGEMGKNGFEKAVEDMKNLNNHIQATHPQTQIILLGHSMGSLLSRRFLQLYGDKIVALILSGTPSPNSMALIGAKLCSFFNSFRADSPFKAWGKNLIHQISLGNFNRKFNHLHPYSKSHWICSDLNIIKEYDNDKKCHFTFSLNSFKNLFYGLRQVFSSYPKPLKNSHLPILFLSGEDDACGNFGKGVRKAYEHLCAQGFSNVSLKLYPSCRHEVFNEISKEQYLQDTLEWLRRWELR